MTPVELTMIGTSVITITGILGLFSRLKTAAKAAATNAAAEAIRGDVGREERERSIRDHASACRFPAQAHAEVIALADDSHKERMEMASTAHRELIEATVRIENAVNGQGNRIDSLTGLLVEIARNGKNMRGGKAEA